MIRLRGTFKLHSTYINTLYKILNVNLLQKYYAICIVQYKLIWVSFVDNVQ